MENGWRCKSCQEQLAEHRHCVMCRKPYTDEEGPDAEREQKTAESVANIQTAKKLGYL